MATIKDVASDAGVAVGTVSKVLNGHYVSPENKRKVEESIERLGYQMNYYNSIQISLHYYSEMV